MKQNLLAAALAAFFALNAQANPKDNVPPLMEPVAKGEVDKVKAMIASGADVNARAEHGITALHLAVCAGYDEIAKLLRAAGADPNAKDDQGQSPSDLEQAMNQRAASLGASAKPVEKKNLCLKTWKVPRAELLAKMPLAEAAEEGELDVVQKRIAEGADLNDRLNATGTTPLMRAALRGHSDVVKALIDAKADVNARDVQGETALMMAAAMGHAKVVHLLIDAGADVSVKDENGKTAFDLAKTDEIKALLNGVKR